MAASWPLSSQGVRLSWLRACCAVAEGADVAVSHTAPTKPSSSRCPSDLCVSAVLGDALHRVAVLGGREGMPRSLGSVYGGCITRFLGGSLRGVVSRVIDTPCLVSFNGVAVSRDGCTLLVSACGGGSHAIHEFRVADGSRRRVIGSKGDGPLQFKDPRQVYIAPDDFVFVADSLNHRVQVLTPSLDFHAFIGEGELHWPTGVCANADVVAVAEASDHRISVFDRHDGALLRRIGSEGSGDGELFWPWALCFMPGERHVAVAEGDNNRVSVFSVDGEFIRHVGVGVVTTPYGVACSAFGELVVADSCRVHASVFSASGELVMTMGHGGCTGVAIHGGTVFAQSVAPVRCVVFE
jgi:DNA-binding beta-propeller fold protein YncE